jgi:hypothetical protein
MTTTVVRPADAELRSALWVAGGFGVFKVLLHVCMTAWVGHEGYGYFRDEMYYLICGRHLAWGYVDQGPLVAVQARLAETMFGRSLVGLRMFAAIGGGIRVFLTGVLAWCLGGKRASQVLAMIGILVAPQYLGGDSYLSMNSVESVFWMSSLLALILIERGGSRRLWLVFGAAAGLGLLNKPDMAFFLVALLIALVLTPQRRMLWTPWMLAGVGLMLLIVAPYVLWQTQNHWPTWEFLENGRIEHKNVTLGPLAFLNAQLTGMHPLNLLLWLPGLVWLLRRERWRWLGVMFVVFLTILCALHAKDYYVVPIYPILFAAGGLAWESWRRTRNPRWNATRLFGFPILESVLVLTGLILLPMSNPVLPPPQWLAYTKALHLYDQANKTETMANGPLPQFYADRFGWQEEVDAITRIYNSLSPEERRRTVILCDNYGEASAVNFLGHGLPVAISSQNNYWLWGPGPAQANIVIDVERTTPEHLQQFADSVQLVGHTGTEFSMPYEHKPIYLLKGMKQSLASLWPDKKNYI